MVEMASLRRGVTLEGTVPGIGWSSQLTTVLSTGDSIVWNYKVMFEKGDGKEVEPGEGVASRTAIRSRVGSSGWTAQLDPVTEVCEDSSVG